MADDKKINKFIRSTPKIYRPGENPVITAFLEAFAASDDNTLEQIKNTKAQLFIRTAEGRPLDRLANSLGVSRSVELGLDDATYQELIPNLSLKAKQIRKAFYDTSDVFWGPLFSRTNIATSNSATYNITAGEKLVIQIDNRDEQEVFVFADDIAASGAATSEEVLAIFERIVGATPSIIIDSITGDEFINIRTNTPGPLGSIEIFNTSTIVGIGKLEFAIGKIELRDQAQRVMIYEIRPNEILIEIPAIVPALRRTLRGSHHWHQNSTIESPVAPDNGIWQGSFLYDPTGSHSAITVTGQNAKLDQTITKNSVLTSIIVDDTSKIEDTNGLIVIGWGTDEEESAIRIRGIPNSKTVLIDPSYIFQKNHTLGSYINIISAQEAFTPKRDGSDLAIYLTSPSGAREAVQEILKTLAAAGVIVNFAILSPDYKYLINNPYVTDDDAPSI